MRKSYLEAVEFATDQLSLTLRNYGASTHTVEPSEFIYIFALQISQGFDDDPLCGTYYKLSDEAFAVLAMKSDSDKGAFDIARRITTTKLLRNEPLSYLERLFAGQVMGGMRVCPLPEGKRLQATFALNLHLVMLTPQLVTKFGLHLTRNDEAAQQLSACDAVSQALEVLGHQKSYRAIKDLLTHKSSARVREVAQGVREALAELRDKELNSSDL